MCVCVFNLGFCSGGFLVGSGQWWCGRHGGGVVVVTRLFVFFFIMGLVGICWVFFLSSLIWIFYSGGILVGNGQWWRGGHGGGDLGCLVVEREE